MPFISVELDPEFLRTLLDFRPSDQRRLVRAVELLDHDERHPSLRVHQLRGDLEGLWSASASDSLRLLFVRLPGGRKRVVRCTSHNRQDYGG